MAAEACCTRASAPQFASVVRLHGQLGTNATACPAQVAGLWIILGMVGAFALLLVGFQSFWLWHEYSEDMKHGTTLSRQSTLKVFSSLGGKSSANLGARSGPITVVAEPSRRSSFNSEVSSVAWSLPGRGCSCQEVPHSQCFRRTTAVQRDERE